jgi:hypothetical protein
MTETTTTKTNPAAIYADSIREALAALAVLQTDGADPVEYDGETFDDADSLREHLEQWPLSVEVRSDWRSIGDDNDNPTEYRILLATGGPAVQVIGELNEHGEPETARIQGQDWFTPWETYAASDPETLDTLLDFARLFYFVNH